MDIDTWRSIFEEELEDRGIFDAWSFSVDENFQGQKGWLQYSLSSFAKFVCSVCHRSWGSSKVHITFYLRLQKRNGQVKMHIFRQKCKLCYAAEYERPTFVEENIEKVIGYLVNRICQKFYDAPTTYSPGDFVKDTREEGPHQYNNCEACAKGVCKYSIDNITETQTKTQRVYTGQKPYQATYCPEPLEGGISNYSIDNNPKTQTTTKYQYMYTYQPSVSQPHQSSYRAEPSGKDLNDMFRRSCSIHVPQKEKKTEEPSTSWMNCIIL